jgi:hypothetical protein
MENPALGKAPMSINAQRYKREELYGEVDKCSAGGHVPLSHAQRCLSGP